MLSSVSEPHLGTSETYFAPGDAFSLIFLFFSYPQPFFCTLAVLSQCSRYSSSDLDRNDEKRAPKALPKHPPSRGISITGLAGVSL